MISDEYVRQLYLKGQEFLAKQKVRNARISPVFFRGMVAQNWKDQHPGSCTRHMSVFTKYKIIPNYCFSCYKVFIEPRSVVELFKLMVIFEQLKLQNDNTRKCTVEGRQQISGTYKGFIYCRGIEEGKEILTMLKKVISDEISEKIPVTLKRGCSEYELAFPEYAQIGQGMTRMAYKEEWQEFEDLADKEFVVNAKRFVGDMNNHPGYNLIDAQVMHAWLRYAATIGDLSYKTISSQFVPPIHNLKCPPRFHPIKEE